jgi:AcrR family transcriptional regulator
MVERIVAAGSDVLLARGYQGATTNHIAAAAGISPGSLYQYFPDKDAVLAEVLDRYTAGVQARIAVAFRASLDEPSVDARVRHVLTAILDTFEENPEPLRVLLVQRPSGAAARTAEFARRTDELVAALLVTGRSRLGELPVDAIAWVLVRTVQHVTSSYVLERPRLGREVVLDELTALIAGYLRERVPDSPR